MEIKSVLNIINRDLFFVSLLTLILFFGLDITWPGIISNYLNINIIFLIAFASGIGYSIFGYDG